MTTQPGPWHRTLAAITTPAHATTPRTPQNTQDAPTGHPDETKPAKRRTRKRHQPSDHHWKIRLAYDGGWRVLDPECPQRPGPCECPAPPTYDDARQHVIDQLRVRALAAIENQEATNQPQEDQ